MSRMKNEKSEPLTSSVTPTELSVPFKASGVSRMEQMRNAQLLAEAEKASILKEETQSTVDVTFRINYSCDSGQSLVLVGNTDQLGAWFVARGLHMLWTEGNHWTLRVAVRRNSLEELEYKYVVISDVDNSPVRWEEGRNHRLLVLLSASGYRNLAIENVVAVQDYWGFPGYK